MPFIDANGVNFHYEQIGEGPDVVMIHGITGNLAIWHLQIIPAMMANYRFTTYDLRGHSYSSMPPSGYRTCDHAAGLAALMDELGIEHAHVVGHSFGADISLHFAILYPDRVDRLVLIEPAIPALIYLRERRDWPGWKYWREKLASGGVEIPEDKWYDEEYLVRASVKIPKQFGFRQGLPRRATKLIKLMETTTAVADYREVAGMTKDKIAEVQHEALVVYGEDSVFLGTYEFLKKNLPHCDPMLIPDSEHYGPLEQPAMLIEAMQEFLHGGSPARRAN